jgi:hypothetical protein
MSFEKTDRSDRSREGAGGAEQTKGTAPGKKTLTANLPRVRALGSVSDAEIESTVEQTSDSPDEPVSSAGQGGPLPQMGAETVAAERAAGRGDSDAAVLALSQLVRDATDPLDLARAECAIQTGRVESPLRIDLWAERLAGLAADARAGYVRMLRARRSPLTLDAATARLQAMSRKRGDAAAIVNAYRQAGRAGDPVAIEQLAALLAANGRSIEAVETQLSGAGSEVTIIEDNAEVDAPKQPVPVAPRKADGKDDRADEAVLAALPPDHAAAYRAALALLGTKTRPIVKPGVKPTKNAPTSSTQSVKSTSTVSGSGGSSAAGGTGQVVRVSAEAFEGVADADKNAHLGMLLLVAHNVPGDLAHWIATCTGTPPDRVKELMGLKTDMDATTAVGNRVPIPIRQRADGGYQGYRIFNSAGQTMTAAEIDADLARQGYIEVSLDKEFYDTHVVPLLDAPERWAWVRADLIAVSYQREIDALEEREREVFARTGRHDRMLMERIIRLKGLRLQYATYAADLRRGTTSVTREMGRFTDEVNRLTALISDAEAKLADARRRLAADLDQRRREQAIYQPRRPATGVTPTADTSTPSPEVSREVEELEQYIADRREEKTSTEQMMGTGDIFPEQEAAERVRRLKDRYETSDGSFKFRSNARATWDAVDGAAAAVSARLWSAIGGTIEYGGPVVALMSGQLWFNQVREDLAQRAYATSAEIDRYAAGRTARAEEVLGKTAVALVQVATSTAIYVVMLGPVMATGGVLGAALIGGRIGSAAGSITALATTGALMSSDQGGAGMAKGALLMGAMPLLGGFGSTALRRALTAFLGQAALDGASQMDLHAAYTAYSRSADYKDAVIAATQNVDLHRMFANGLMAALLAGGPPAKTGDAPLLRVGEEFYRADGTRVTDAGEIAGGKSSSVAVNRGELDSITSLGKAGNREAALDLIARARTRTDAIAETKADVDASGRAIERLEAVKKPSSAQKRELGDLRARQDRSQAQTEVLTAAQEGKPISRDLIERAGGQVPMGYAEAVPGGDYVPRPGLAAEQSAAWATQREAASKLAAEYKTELETMNRLSRELVAEQAKPTGKASRLRAALTAAASKVRELRAAFERAVSGRSPDENRPNETKAETQVETQAETVPTEPIVVDPATKPLGKGGQGTVYPVDVGGKAMAVKLVDGAGTNSAALDGARLPARYGGLGSGELVQVQIGDVLSEGVLMPRVEGTPLSRATRTLPSHREAFSAYMDAAVKDEIVLSDFHSGNVIVRDDGGITIVDCRLMTKEKFFEASRRASKSTPEEIAVHWEKAGETFQKGIESLKSLIDEKMGGPKSPDVPGKPAELPVKPPKTETQPKTQPEADVRPTERPPLLENDIIREMAARTEADVNNIIEGTCATAALRNTISAQLRGMKAYVIEIEGLTQLGRILERFGVREGNVGKLLERMGASTTSAHAIAAIQGRDGVWRYVSWGRVEADYNVFAREAYGEMYITRGTWETGDHVRWMVSNKWDYPNPTGLGRVQRALFGWMITVGK